MRILAPIHLLLYLAHVRQCRPKGSTYKKCAIFKPDNLGDVVLSLGAIRCITERFGEEHCSIVCNANTAELLHREFPKLDIVAGVESRRLSERRLWKTMRKLRQLKQKALFHKGVDLLISLRHHRSMHLDMLLSAIPATVTVGAPSSPWSEFEGELTASRLCFDKTASLENEFECKELAWHAAVLSSAFEVDIRAHDILSRINGVPRTKLMEPRIVIAPFAGERVREIGLVQLKQIVLAVQRQCRIPTVILSGVGDKRRSDELAANLRESGSFDVSSICTETLEQMMQVLADAAAVLTADSSPAHLSTALDVPTVVLIGGGHPGWFGYWRRSDKQVWLDNRLPCYGCNWNCIYDKPVCITDISPELIAAEVIRRLPPLRKDMENCHNQII